MKSRALPVLLVAGFAIAVGDFAFRVWNPSPTSEYMIEGVFRPFQLQSAGEPKKHLYLRRTWRLTEPPQRAWLQLIGHDDLDVFVNGRRVGRADAVGNNRLVGQVLDITAYMHVGENSVAIHAPQRVLGRPPQIAVEGECEFADGSTKSLADPDGWRAADVYDRRGEFWFETAFDDTHWVEPALGAPVRWRAQVDVPPRSITQARRSQWITPRNVSDGTAAFVRSFDVPGAALEGWLRIQSTGSYRVAINGWLLTNEQPHLGIRKPIHAREQTFDISPLLRSGSNTVSILAETAGENPRILADVEATTLRGDRTYVATNAEWKSAGGYMADWLEPDLESADWQPCEAEVGYLGVTPRTVARELAAISPPGAFWFARAAKYAGSIALTGLIAAVGATITGRLLKLTRPDDSPLPEALPYLALLPSTIAAATGGLMTWDMAFAAHDVYQPLWLMGLWLMIAAQWLLLLAVNTGRAAAKAFAEPRIGRSRTEWAAIAACWLAIGGIAFWLRARDLTAEPIHHDEVTAYAFTASIFEYGFPGGQVHPDIPFGYAATNELCFYVNALCALFVDDPLLVIRIPSLAFSMASLALVAYIGWKWFDPYVGFVAAILFALSPHIISMADFGRYLSQVQFFTLLTMWLTYEAVRGNGAVNARLTWFAALSFIAMYYSWEGSGMFAIGLALAVLFHRRRHLKSLLSSPHMYLATTLVLLAIFAQNAHRILQQTQRLWYGEGISSLTVKPMWRYPFFQHEFCLMNASWIKDALLPMAALLIACGLAFRHRWRFPLRFSIICLLTNAEVMAALLPVRTNRYSYHLSSIFILVAATALVATAQSLMDHLRVRQLPAAYRWYTRAVTVAAVGVVVALMSGWTLRTSELTDYVTGASDVRQLRIPDWDEPMSYLSKNVKEGDVILSIFPHTTNYMFAVEKVLKGEEGEPRTVDGWVQSRLVLQATIGDTTQVPRDRRSGAVMLYNLEQVQKLFDSHDRIWYCTLRSGQSALNDGIVSKFLREHMDVVSEDYATALMVRDKNHRPAPIRLEEEEAGQLATEYYLH
jgi:hypothetical protein